jgi:YfiH family protein
VITLGALNDLSPIRHAFFTRQNGVSTGLYASNNVGLGSKDDPAAVAENRARCMARFDLPADRLVTVHQVHSPDVAVVEAPFAPGAIPRADAMVSATKGLALGILTADCAPILLADAEARVIGAAHAGWKGALGGVAENTVAAMVRLGARPERIVAAIGPCIAQRSYEVGPEFPGPITARDPRDADLFAPSRREGRFMFDLAGYVGRRLAAAGVTLLARAPNDTCAEEDRFFSYRRATLRGEPDYGRGLSAIAIVE